VAVRYALGGLDARGRFLAVLAFPFVFSWLLHMGFYNFCLSTALFFFAAGYWFRHQRAFSPRSVAVLALLLTLLYFAHIVGLVMVLILVGILCLWLPLVPAVSGSGEDADEALAGSSLRRVVGTALAALPVALLTARFLVRSHRMPLEWYLPLDRLWQVLRRMESLISFQESEALLAGAVFWGFVLTALGLVAVRAVRPRIKAWDGLFVAAGAYTCAYFVLPPGLMGGSYLNERVALFPFFALILWFATHPLASRALRVAVQALASGISVAWLALHMGKYAELADGFREYRSIEDWVEADTTLLPLRYGGAQATPRVDVFLKTAGHVAASKNLVELVNHEGHKRHFPIAFRRGLDPYELLGNAETRPPCVDFLSYSARTGIAVDYVLTWHLRPVELREACVRSVLEQLQSGYELIYTSRPRGLAKLYRRKEGNGKGATLPASPSVVPERER
jgi:hypothetical protein